MLFPSKEFIFIFLPTVLFVYYVFLRKTKELKNIFLLIVSLIFYAWGEPVYVWLMIICILVNYLAGLVIDKCRASKCKSYICLFITVLINLGILGYFKYYQFIILQINRFLHTNISVPDIALPIGISFFTFQAMSYVFDVYRGKGQVQKNPLHVGLYISLFPQLIAGPIVRYETVANQIKERKETFTNFSKGAARFIVGLIKKVLIANNMSLIADAVFGNVYAGAFHGSMVMAWVGAIAYTFQIFFDFSGYSDMAIGLGKMFGFEFEENFNYPYISGSITEFWRRWHISMQTWFRDYLYIPLGGNRKGKARKILNLFIVWLCTGIWHGANWTFLAWGLMNFFLLMFESITGISKKEKNNAPVKKSFSSKLFGAILHVYTLVFIVINWVIFRSPGLGAAKTYILSMFGIGSNGLWGKEILNYFVYFWPYMIFAIIGCAPVIPALDKKFSKCKWWNLLYTVTLLMLFLFAMTFIFNNAYSPFIYFNF